MENENGESKIYEDICGDAIGGDAIECQREVLNLYQKLLELRKAVPYIRKTAKGFGYAYADEMNILAAFRPHMDDLGLILEVDMEPPRMIGQTSLTKSEFTDPKKGDPKVEKQEFIFEVGINFTWVNVDNPNEKVHKRIYLQDIAGDPKKFGGLMTYATRFFLTKYFSIPTNEMDPDDFYEKSDRLSPTRINTLEDLLRGRDEMKKSILSWAGINDIADLPAQKYKTVVGQINKRIAEEGESTNAKA